MLPLVAVTVKRTGGVLPHPLSPDVASAMATRIAASRTRYFFNLLPKPMKNTMQHPSTGSAVVPLIGPSIEGCSRGLAKRQSGAGCASTRSDGGWREDRSSVHGVETGHP